MKLLRLILVLVLSMAIPVEGVAAVPSCVCPMQMQDEAPAAATDMADCCKHTDSNSSSDSSCQPGQSCGINGVVLGLPTSLHFSALTHSVFLTDYRSPVFIEQTASIWHPPQLP